LGGKDCTDLIAINILKSWKSSNQVNRACHFVSSDIVLHFALSRTFYSSLALSSQIYIYYVYMLQAFSKREFYGVKIGLNLLLSMGYLK
jgi:hypothetical protein